MWTPKTSNQPRNRGDWIRVVTGGMCVALLLLAPLGCKKKNQSQTAQPTVPVNEPPPPVIEVGTLQAAVDAWTVAGGIADPAALVGMAVPDAQNAAKVHGAFVDEMYLISEEDMRTLRSPWEEDVEDIVSRHTDALANVHAAVELPFVNWGSPLEKGMAELGLRYIPYCQRITLLLRAEAITHFRANDLDAAMKSINAGLIVARHAGQEPIIEAAQVQDWCEIVMLGAVRRMFVDHEIPDTSVMDATLASNDARDRLSRAVLGAGTLAIIEIGREEGNRWSIPLEDDQYPVHLARDLIWTMEAWSQAALALREPYHERAGEESFVEFPPTWAPLSSMYYPELKPIDDFAAQCETVRALAKTALQLRARREQIGRYPPADRFVSQLPIDPYTGDRVLYTLNEDGGFVLTTTAYVEGDGTTGIFRWAWN